MQAERMGEMPYTEDKYRNVMEGKEIPLLPLDNKWHQLFTQTEPSPKILRLEKQLNKLIQRQGKLNTETKEIRKVKKKLMEEIVIAADELNQGVNEKINDKKLEANERLVRECSDKLEAYKQELNTLPAEIEELNKKLMIATMEVCYSRLQTNSNEIEAITKWINSIRVELKKKVIRKQEKEEANRRLYSYMHDIFGAEMLEVFDMKYNPLEENNETDLTKPLGGIKEEK